MRAGLAAGLVLALCGPSSSATLWQESFESPAASGQPGEVVGKAGQKGWHSQTLGRDLSVPNYLSFPVAGSLVPEEGTIELLLARDDAEQIEALFSLVDPSGKLLLVAQIHWNGFYQREVPCLKFEGWHVRNLWRQDHSNPRFGRRLILDEVVNFPSAVAPGQRFHLAFTWGPKPADCQIYFDGTRLETLSDVPFGMAQIIEAAATIAIGAQPAPGKPGGYSAIRSVVEHVRFSDTALAPEEFFLYTAIESVTHDAFAQAGYSGRLVAGETVNVVLTAEPGGAASFDVVQPGSVEAGTADRVEISNVPMAEDAERAGTYRGAYTVKFGDEADKGLVLGRFTSAYGAVSKPLAAERPIDIDGRVHIQVASSNDLIPADRASRSGLTVVGKDANGKAVADHQLKLTLSTTDEYTGTVGGGTFEDEIGGSLEVDWRGITDSFGEVTAQYVTGFAAKTILFSAKDMVSGDVGVGWVRSYIDGTVDIVVKRPESTALAFAGTMEITASRTWLTADGKSRSRITAVVRDEAGSPMAGHNVSFTMAGDNGSLRVIQSRTDGKGRAYADYVAGTVMGQVTIEVRDLTSGLSGAIEIELRPDAPAEIKLVADPGEVVIGGDGATITATVKDINGNPNNEVDVVYGIASGEGSVSAPSVATGKDGKASVRFSPGQTPGVVTVKGTVTSRIPTPEELSAAEGAVFLFGLPEDPGALTVVEWLVKTQDEVVRGQELVVLAGADGTMHKAKALRDGTVSVFAAEEGDEVQYGDTLCYILLVEEK